MHTPSKALGKERQYAFERVRVAMEAKTIREIAFKTESLAEQEELTRKRKRINDSEDQYTRPPHERPFYPILQVQKTLSS